MARALTTVQQCIQALKAVNRQLKRDNYPLKKSVGLLCNRVAIAQQIIALKLKKANFHVTDICRNLGHARTTYYRRAASKAINAKAV